MASALVLIGIFIFRNISRTSSTVSAPTPAGGEGQVQVPEFNTGEGDNPQFNLASYKCSNFNYEPGASSQNPQFDPKNFTWQTSAPRQKQNMPKINQPVEFGLRNKNGKASDSFDFAVKVYQPDGVISQGKGVLKADQWAMQSFPKDFEQGSTSKPGTYTFVYEIAGVPVACDGFEVIQ